MTQVKASGGDGGVGGEADCRIEGCRQLSPRLLQSHSPGCDCTANGAWSFKHGILAILPSNSASENDNQEHTRLYC